MAGAFVCIVELRLHFGQAGSLKSKRKELHSLKALLRRRFGAAVAEVAGQETWQRSTVVCALVGDARVGDRGDELARFAEARLPEGCVARVEVRSLEDVRGL